MAPILCIIVDTRTRAKYAYHFIGTIGLSLCQRGNCGGNVSVTPEISDGKPHKQQQDKNPDAEKQPYACFRRTATTLSIAIMMMFFVFHNRKL